MTTISQTETRSRLQLALNVDDLDAAVEFYSRLFATEPHKRRPGYVNFEIADPPLKLVLFENPSETGTLNHLGIEVFSADDVASTEQRLSADGLDPTRTRGEVECCFATKSETWVDGPDGTRWEVYVVTDDHIDDTASSTDDACCS